MKKVIFTMIALFSVMFGNSAFAQTTVESSKFFDNWSIGLNGGVVTPLHNSPFWGDMRGVVGLEARKDITPVIGLGVEGEWSVNTSSWTNVRSYTAFDHQLLGVFMTGNLNNLFVGYRGTPRLCEVETNIGIGWLHGYESNKSIAPYNSWYTKFGANLNFNLGETKAWTLSLKPAIVYDMQVGNKTQFNINQAYLQVLVGVTYHFKNSNGTHSFSLCDKRYTQAEWDCLNEEINALRNRPVEVVEVEKIVVNEVTVDNTVLNNAIGFKLNSAEILPTAYASLENVATWLKEHPDTQVDVVGHSSAAEGSAEYNEQLSIRRGESVKETLVNEFGVNTNQLTVVGKGSSVQPYSSNDWNRVVTFQIVQ